MSRPSSGHATGTGGKDLVASSVLDKEENYSRIVVDEIGKHRTHVKDILVVRQKDKTVRFTTSNTAMTPYDINNIFSAFSDGQQARLRGVNIQGRDFEAIRADDYSIYAKRDKQGVLATKTPESIIIATYDDKMQPAIAVELLERLGDIIRRIETQFARNA